NLERAQDRITALQADQRELSGITQLRASVQQAQQQTADLMSSDVDLDAFLTAVWEALPDGMTITQASVAVPPLVGQSTTDSANSGFGSLDTSEESHVGSMTLSGTGTQIADLPVFIDNLAKIPGVFDPVPVSNAAAGATQETTQYSVQLALTDTVLS